MKPLERIELIWFHGNKKRSYEVDNWNLMPYTTAQLHGSRFNVRIITPVTRCYNLLRLGSPYLEEKYQWGSNVSLYAKCTRKTLWKNRLRRGGDYIFFTSMKRLTVRPYTRCLDIFNVTWQKRNSKNVYSPEINCDDENCDCTCTFFFKEIRSEIGKEF